MRFMMLVKGDRDSEAGVLPSTELFAALDEYTEEAVKAGAMLGGGVLQPSSKGARVRHSGGKTSVIGGPFSETDHLIYGYALLDVESMDEAIELAKRFPDQDREIEIREVYAPEEFGDGFTRLLKEQDERLRAQTAEQ